MSGYTVDIHHALPVAEQVTALLKKTRDTGLAFAAVAMVLVELVIICHVDEEHFFEQVRNMLADARTRIVRPSIAVPDEGVR